MANTSSWAWPNIFNISQNRVAIYEDNKSVTSRGRLLLLTEPTEIYNEPSQGVGLKRYMFRYNSPNVKAEICDRSKDQFSLYDPSIDAPKTEWTDGLKFTGSDGNIPSMNDTIHSLKMTMAVHTVYGSVLNLDLNDIVGESR